MCMSHRTHSCDVDDEDGTIGALCVCVGHESAFFLWHVHTSLSADENDSEGSDEVDLVSCQQMREYVVHCPVRGKKKISFCVLKNQQPRRRVSTHMNLIVTPHVGYALEESTFIAAISISPEVIIINRDPIIIVK